MTIDSHKRTLAIIHIAFGFLRLFVFLFCLFFFSAFFPFIREAIIEEEGREAIMVLDIVSSFFSTIMIGLIVISALPSIIGGFATLRNASWGLVLLLISGCLSLLSFPLGTALGAYSIWVFVENGRTEKQLSESS